MTDLVKRIGSCRSLLPPRLVGVMRGLGLTAAAGAAGAAATLGWAYREAQMPVLRQIDVAGGGGNTSSGTSVRVLRILHVSDIHMHERAQFIGEFLRQVAAEHDFDLVVSTGDNLSDAQSLDLLLEACAPLLSKPGCFVLGSNDYYATEVKPWASYLSSANYARTYKRAEEEPDLPWLSLVEAFEQAGWVDLSNRVDSLQVPLADGSTVRVGLVGVDDPHILRDHMPDLRPLSAGEPELRLGLTHAPYQRVLDAFTAGGVDLVFAGHTHGGQLRVPGVGAVVTNADVPRRYARGLHEWLAADARTGWPRVALVNVSAGLGTSPFAPVRFACRPEATLLTIALG